MNSLDNQLEPSKWQDAWEELPEVTGIEIEHIFLPGLYIKKSKIKAGLFGSKHVHTYDHLSILSRGVARVVAGKIGTTYRAGDCILIKAGVEHQIEALTDIWWLCLHPTDETDVKKLEGTIFNG